MDYFLIALGIALLIMGLAGCILPVIPGPPLSYAALLALHFTSRAGFSARFLIIWAVVVVVVSLLDYLIPAWGAKKFGGSKYGIWGSLIGLLAGLFFLPPIGIILGPFFGAIIGEFWAGKETKSALRSGFGTFIGFLAGVTIKLITSGLMTWYFIKELIRTI